MIEIEKNFDLNPGDKEALLVGATLIRRKSFTDIYYDNASYNLTSRDFWLRTRDGRFELKVPLNETGADRQTTDQYRELEIDQEIADELDLEIKTDLAAAVVEANYKPFATITTKRESWQKGIFHLDFDEVSDMNYTTMEVEIMVADEKQISEAEKLILDFAKQHNIFNPGHGKVIEYLLKNNPDHHRVLKVSGVIRD